MEEIFSGLFGLLGSATGGGVIGLVAGLLNKREERKRAEQEQHFELEKLKLESAEANAERSHAVAMADKKMQQAVTEGEIERDVKELDRRIAVDTLEAKGWYESIKNGFKETGIYAVDLVRGMMRPFITAWLLIASTMVTFDLFVMVGGLEALPDEISQDLAVYVVHQLFNLTSMSISWWFASRPHNQLPRGRTRI